MYINFKNIEVKVLTIPSNTLRLDHFKYVFKDKLNFDGYDFATYIEDKYGIKMNMVNGNITDGYQIVDEQKYLIFLLRFE